MLRNTILSVVAIAAAASSANAAIVINEIYPGGGGGTASNAFTRDYVEIYNTDVLPVILDGYKLQYAAAGATSGFTNTVFNFGTGSLIAPGDYITIATGAAGTAGATLTNAQVTAFASTSNASLQGSNGSVRLLDAAGNVVDLVGYGTVSNSTDGTVVKYETLAAASPTSGAVSIGRTGFADTSNNSLDFSSQTPSPMAGTASTAVAAVVPEPASLALIGLAGLAALRRRR